jgi:glycosyltransferase involved in cell wall biosynthesis
LRLLFVNSSGFLPHILGGVETTTFQLCQQLKRMGHEVAVWHKLESRDFVWFRNRIVGRLTGNRFPRARFRDLTVFRGYFGGDTGPTHDFGPAHLDVVRRFTPHVVVVSGGTDGTLALAAKLKSAGPPVYHYFHDIMSIRHDLASRDTSNAVPSLNGLGFLANSHYTATTAAALLGVDSTVIHPFVDYKLYRTQSLNQNCVTMINPREIKGGDTALALAQACPDIPFLFIEAWSSDDPFVAKLRGRVRQLANVTWQKSTSDMSPIYAKTKLLLVPSRWEETWGRVVTEAHISGIPALASNIGGLPESVGPGGYLVAPDAPISEWVKALRQIWNNSTTYQDLQDKAKAFSQRDESVPEVAASNFLGALRGAG